MPTKTKSRHANGHRLSFQPQTYRGVQQGINKLANAIRPTLGPHPRVVAIDRILDERMPELLDSGGVIAKRIIRLPGWHEDVGAMYLRDVLWRLHNQVGDGTATAAVLFQHVYNEGVRYVTAGGDPVHLRNALERGVREIIAELSNMTIELAGQDKLVGIARTLCYEPELADILGEVFDIVGEYGRVEIRKGNRRGFEREYVEGMYWERGLVSRDMITDHDLNRTEFQNTALVISDLEINEPEQLYPPLEVALRAKRDSLVIIADKFSDKVVGFLLANKKPDQFQAIAVRTPGAAKSEKAAALEDVAILTGGRPFVRAAGATFERITSDDFGYARRFWVDLRNFAVIGGQGDPRVLRQHIHTLRAAYNGTEDIVIREPLLKRIGKLLGGSATVWVGGSTEHQLDERLELAKRTAAALRGAMMEGVVLGGGVALLECRRTLQARHDAATNTDERAAYRILLDALTQPLRVIADNAGFDDREVMAQMKLAGKGHGFDVISGQVVDMAEAGIYDAAMTQKSAVYAGIGGAALALTIDVLVHRNLEDTLQPIEGPGKRKRL